MFITTHTVHLHVYIKKLWPDLLLHKFYLRDSMRPAAARWPSAPSAGLI